MTGRTSELLRADIYNAIFDLERIIPDYAAGKLTEPHHPHALGVRSRRRGQDHVDRPRGAAHVAAAVSQRGHARAAARRAPAGGGPVRDGRAARARRAAVHRDEFLVVTDTRIQGGIVLGTGLAVAAAGATMLAIDLTVLRKRSARRLAVAPALLPTMAGLDLRIRFSLGRAGSR